MKTKEELNTLAENETRDNAPTELSDEELTEVSGGLRPLDDSSTIVPIKK